MRDIARVHYQKHQIDSARYYYERALDPYHPNTCSGILIELAGLLCDIKEYDSAKVHAITGIQLNTDTMNIHQGYLALGGIYLETGRLDSAFFYLNKSLVSPRLQTQAASHNRLSELAELQENWQRAFLEKNKYNLLRDAIEIVRNNTAMQQVEAMYNFRQIEYEAEEYRLQKTMAERRMLMIVLIVVVLIAIGITVFLFYNKKTHEKQENLEKQLRASPDFITFSAPLNGTIEN